LAGPGPAHEQQEHELANLGRHLELALLLETTSLPVIYFRRALILQYDDRPPGQVVCILASNVGEDRPNAEIRSGSNTVYWSTSTHAYILRGNTSP
jgi:hypothetical protein